jgi:hypothetical protein
MECFGGLVPGFPKQAQDARQNGLRKAIDSHVQLDIEIFAAHALHEFLCRFVQIIFRYCAFDCDALLPSGDRKNLTKTPDRWREVTLRLACEMRSAILCKTNRADLY